MQSLESFSINVSLFQPQLLSSSQAWVKGSFIQASFVSFLLSIFYALLEIDQGVHRAPYWFVFGNCLAQGDLAKAMSIAVLSPVSGAMAIRFHWWLLSSLYILVMEYDWRGSYSYATPLQLRATSTASSTLLQLLVLTYFAVLTRQTCTGDNAHCSVYCVLFSVG